MLLLNMFIYKYILVLFLIIILSIKSSFSEDKNYNIWLSELESEAIKRGISKDTFINAMKDVIINEKIKKLDKKQPERIITFNDYLKRSVNNKRIEIGKKKYNLYERDVNEIAKAYGVQARFIMAIWGIETNYGRYTGSFPVISSLTTLAFNGRRAKFFRRQLLDALEIIDKGYIELENMKGSWAGAMGQSQFMPSSYIEYAQDYDKDGKKDIWSNHLDVFASIAFYLKSHGWDYTKTWGREVLVPEEILNLYDKEYKHTQTLKYWSDKNIKSFNGKNIPYLNLKADLILPDGRDGKAYLVYNNFHKIKKYNASTYYALSVGILSDRIEY